MTPILSPAGAPILDEIARDRTFLAFDFDGTLAPIVEDRTAARMRASTRALLRTASLLYPCAVVSGRARADVAARVADAPLAAIVGNHGAEPGFGPLDGSLRAQVAVWRDALRRSLRDAEGVEIEDKRFSLALHYRRARSPRSAARRILAEAAALQDAAVFGGHAVVNVLPKDAPTKGDAIRALCGRLGARLAVYVGDDTTDEEAFRAEVVRIGIRIGDTPDSSADYSLGDQSEVDDLLRALIAARVRKDGLGDRWQGLVRMMEA